MTLLIVAAVVMLAVRIAVILSVCMVQYRENRLPSGAEHPTARVSHRMTTFRVPAQNYLTKDNVPVRVDAVVCFRVVDADETPTSEQDHHDAMSRLAQSALRSVIGSTDPSDPTSDSKELGEESTASGVDRGPQDAPRWGPQDAVYVAPSLAQVEQSVVPLDPTRPAKYALPELKADLGAVLAVARKWRATKDACDVEAGRATDGTILDLVPRPVGGPSYLGGRDDDAYLRGWDDGVDWIKQGNQEDAPAWGGVAYMTGWKDAVKACAAAGLGEHARVIAGRVGRAA